MLKITIFLTLLSNLVVIANTLILPDTFLRDWNAYSRMSANWLGNLTITSNKIIFSKLGSYDFKILDIQTNECVLNVLSFEGSNKIFRLGPIKESTLSFGHLGGTQMSVTTFEKFDLCGKTKI